MLGGIRLGPTGGHCTYPDFTLRDVGPSGVRFMLHFFQTAPIIIIVQTS